MKHIFNRFFIFSFCFLSLHHNSYSQRTSKKGNLIYVDKQGVIRWNKDNKEAAFFGVNYTVPFAYGYRSHKALGVDLEKAIDQDVYHFARLGFNAFRVHVWDTEITDSAGNLIENDHLRLFDYLVSKLRERILKSFLPHWLFGEMAILKKMKKPEVFQAYIISNKY
jgi:beta-glucosidase/6-phospho-beta-glucosidase/beta-galactosidase